MKVALVVTGLLLLLVANLLMLYSTPLSPYLRQEGFQDATTTVAAAPGMPTPIAGIPAPSVAMASAEPNMGRNANSMVPGTAPVKEAFTSYFLENSAGAKDTYQPIGAYDGVTLPTGNSSSVWRYTAPNEKLLGDEFKPGPDSLFMFKNNQCKPECCGASFSCGGGCVCTTPQQRQYIAERGGNRTKPEDSA